MLTDKYFSTDKERKRKKNFPVRARAQYASSEYARAHVRENFFDGEHPPPLPCLICSCPAIWSTVYEPTEFRCSDCEPPPGGWHWLTGGWSFVARRLMLVVDVGIVDAGTDGAERWWWESFPRIDWKMFEV